MSINWLNNKFNKKQSLLLIIIEAVFLLIIWIPNLAAIYAFAPSLVSAEKLKIEWSDKCDLFTDVAKYYACAQIAKTSPNQIWNLTRQQNWFKNYLNITEPIDLYSTKKLGPAQYTPQAIVMFMPLTMLSLHEAISFFEIFSLFCLVIPVSLLLRRCCQLSIYQILLWWLIVLAAAPSTENFCYGQVNGILSGLAAIFLLNWQHKNDSLAALALALSIAIKPHRALIMLIMALVARKFRLLFFVLIFSLLLLVAAVFILGIEPVLQYPRALLTIEVALDKHQLPAPINLIVSILGPISVIFGSHVARLASLPLTLISLAIIYLIWRKAILAGKHTYGYAYASSVLCNLILGPHEHYYDLLLLSVVWATTISTVEFNKIFMIKERGQYFWCILFVLFPALTWVLYFQTRNGYFGAWHLPLLILMFKVSILKFKYSTRTNLKDNPL